MRDNTKTSIIIALVGVIYMIFILIEASYILFISNPLGSTWYSGMITSIPFIVIVIYGSLSINDSFISKEHHIRILYWFLGSSITFVLINIFIMITMPPDTLFQILSWLRWSLTIGSGSGLIIGAFESRSIEKAIQAEREKVCAEEAEEKRKMLAYLNATLRHEVLNTASVVIGYSDLLLSKHQDDEDVSANANIIKEQTEDMENVIEDVRLLLESTQEESDTIPIDVNDMLKQETKTLKKAKNEVDINTNFEENVVADAQKPIQRAFSNILWNAVEHNDNDIPKIKITTDVSSDDVLIYIKDNGPGIPESELDELFEKEIRHDANHGLGLTLTKTLIKSYDGSLVVEETNNNGTTFKITLPRILEQKPLN